MPTLGLACILHHFAEARQKTHKISTASSSERPSKPYAFVPASLTVQGVQGCWEASCLKKVFLWTEEGHEELVLLTPWGIISTALEGQVGVGGSNRGISVMPNLKLTGKGGQGEHLLRLPAHGTQREGQLLVTTISQGWQWPLDTWDFSSKQFQPSLGQSLTRNLEEPLTI